MNTTTQRYYWSKLHSDFFERDDIKIIRGMPNGCEVSDPGNFQLPTTFNVEYTL